MQKKYAYAVKGSNGKWLGTCGYNKNERRLFGSCEEAKSVANAFSVKWKPVWVYANVYRYELDAKGKPIEETACLMVDTEDRDFIINAGKKELLEALLDTATEAVRNMAKPQKEKLGTCYEAIAVSVCVINDIKKELMEGSMSVEDGTDVAKSLATTSLDLVSVVLGIRYGKMDTDMEVKAFMENVNGEPDTSEEGTTKSMLSLIGLVTMLCAEVLEASKGLKKRLPLA